MEGTEDHFSLKWSNFRSSLTEGFHDFLQEEMMVDVTLAAEGKFVQAHKLVLSVCSPYFKNLFKVNPCKHPIVILKDVGHNELSYMLQFMYKGEVGVRHEDLPSFLKLADTLKVKGLAGEKFKGEEVGLSDKLESTIARVRKKKNKNIYSDFDIENTESELPSDKQKEKKNVRGRKRRWSSKPETVRKVKREKYDERRLESASGSGSDDEDDNPLAKLIVDKVQSGESSKCSESQCDLKNGFSGENDKDADDEDNDDNDDDDDDTGHTDDFNISPSFFHPENSTETEQTPQEVLSVQRRSKNVRTSLIWKYFIKYPASATCRLCGRNFKGFRPHTSIECHLKTRHYRQYLDFTRNREEQRKQLARDQFGQLFSRYYAMTNYNY